MHRGAWWATVHGKAWDSQQREEVCCVLGFSPGQSLPALDQPLLSLNCSCLLVSFSFII